MRGFFSVDPSHVCDVRPSRTVGLSVAQESKLKARLRKQSPSEPWVEAQFRTVTTTDPRGQIVPRRIHDPHVFPPGGARTAMVRCRACEVFNPPNAFERGVCLDHSAHAGWGPSPSAVAICALQYFNLRLSESELPGESKSSLRREIRAKLRSMQKGQKKMKLSEASAD